ncbi:uncharacterized protein LOC129183274 [Dunckerocampus dactyliophorus]|uniref:uncharacterized protein LOC129183274 n=1 Tax=Dunckerocampus dactyliophorus TaxID=161453 RepID=UPI0024056DFF|nr:uncharacterized protein LOC129183274 [Dunckerocampus dactyliophorus]XP_054636312.1 uncharacterized protein LOC129183274 [Dunckerocampus dactyliophorus]XP_054636314.1 uncharacterized protein LOC129183274 [Dunckerocampus dactyliophorus]XP_054636315.1 uncharacterized protein LOC129183274 [Dunckerocampus dactyliophorus]XP_054636316.1 uncharacterized protein LOC129183274 [Dunckerocampus dactyliophorus]
MSNHMQHYGSNPPELRLVLLGNIGCGKTSSADTILGQLSDMSSATPRKSQLRQDFTEDRKVTLVEAPRWYWNGLEMEESVKKETERAVTLLAPGPHAFLLLVPVSQFTEMDGRVPAQLQQVFGQDVLEHTMVLLTCGDYLMGRTAEEYIQKEHPGLRRTIGLCGGRYHVINNRHRRDREQVQKLLDKVDDMVRKNGVHGIKTRQEREMEERVLQRKRELMESFRMQQEAKRESLASTYTLNTDTSQRSVDRVESYRDVWERTRQDEIDGINGGASDVLQSTPTVSAPGGWRSGLNDDGTYERRSFRLNSDGARLSQMLEESTSPKVVSTFHHRINSFEERSPGASPTSSSHSPVFPPDPSSLTFTASPDTLSSPSSPELRLVMLGRSGSGKSAAGNAILGQDEFESRPGSLVAITQECAKKKAVVAGRRVAVVDTPDWFHSERTPNEVRAQISSCVALSSPGPHAFILCVPTDQPAKVELQDLCALETVFGQDAVEKHTLVLFTYADRLRESGKAGIDSIEAYIASQRGDLLKLVEKCGDRFHVMERGGANVEELLEKVEQIAAEAGGQCYSCPAFQEAENRVRERQAEITRERRRKKMEEENFRAERRSLYPYMQTVAEAEEEVREEEIEKTRAEAELSVSTMNIESLPSITMANMSPSMLQSVMEKLQSNLQMLPKVLSDSSVWVSDSAKKVMNSPVWGSVGSGAKNVQKVVADSSVWGTVGAQAGHVSKLVGDKLPKVVVDSSACVGSGAKAAVSSSVWEKVGSGAKMVADNSIRVGSGIGSGAKSVARSPMWGKVRSGAKSGAKLVADGSVKLGTGAKKVAQSPVWGKVGSGAKAGAKMVTESSVWEKMTTNAKKVPKVVIGGALLGLVLGLFLGGAIGGAAGAVVGSAVTEVGRQKFAKKSMPEKVERRLNDTMDSLVKQGEKVMKTD